MVDAACPTHSRQFEDSSTSRAVGSFFPSMISRAGRIGYFCPYGRQNTVVSGPAAITMPSPRDLGVEALLLDTAAPPMARRERWFSAVLSTAALRVISWHQVYSSAAPLPGPNAAGNSTRSFVRQ